MNNSFKSTLLALAIASSFSVSAVEPPPITNGGSGKIHFSGTIIDAPCSIAPESQEQTVELGSVSLKAFKNIGDHSQAATGVIKLQGCDLDASDGTSDPYSKVSVTFSGVTDSNSPELLANNGSAQGVGVRLLDADGNPVALESPIEYSVGTNANLKFQAYIEAISATVTEGEVSSDATFKLSYK